MDRSESISKLAVALVKAQKKIENAVKGANNPFFKSKYANLNSVIEACKEHLNNEGIAVLQPVCSDASGDCVETVLLHESGEFMSSKTKLIMSKQDMQAYGSAVSYARRYGLQSMVFVGADDDDGEAAVDRASKPTTSPPPKVETKTEEAPKPVRSSFKNKEVSKPKEESPKPLGDGFD